MGHCADRLNVLDTKAGALLGDITRYLLAVGLVAGIGMAMGFQPEGGAPGMLAGIGLLLVFALALSWARCAAPASPSTTRNSKACCGPSPHRYAPVPARSSPRSTCQFPGPPQP